MVALRCDACEAFTQFDAGDAEPRCAGCESELDPSGKPQEVDGPALGRAIALSPVPLLVDFWAPGCAPCVISAPILKALGSRMAGRIVVLSVNVEDAPGVGETHAIEKIPTFALFVGREEISRRMGLLLRGQLEGWVRATLAS
jgi:thioredoxin 2